MTLPDNEQLAATRKKNKKLVMWMLSGTLLMFGFGFAMVPLYNVFCQVTGINGKPADTAIALGQHETVDKSRTITVEFVATRNERLPWEFHPDVTRIKIHPGELKQTRFYAKNDTNHRMTVQAIPSITPGAAAKYFKKTECFCFTQQTFDGGEAREMPLIFHVDRDLPKEIRTITLSYTMFDAGKFAKKQS